MSSKKPIRRATPRKKKRKLPHLKKKRFIEAWIANRGNVTDAAKTAEINPATFYKWIQKDPAFLRQMVEAEQDINDYVRDKLIANIDKGNVQSILFYLKKRHPDFKDKANVNIREANFKVDFIVDSKVAEVPSSISGLQERIEEAELVNSSAV